MEISITITTNGSKFSPIVFSGDFVQEIERAGAVGYKAAELHIQDPNKINRKAIFEALQKAGIQVSTIGTGQAYVDEGLSFSSPDPVIRQQAVQRIKDQIQLAKELNAKVIIGTIKGKMPENPEDKVIARKWVVDCLRECTACAESFKTQLTLEAVNRYETNFLNTAQETVEFIEEVGSSAMGLHLDTFHMNIEEVSMEAALRTYAKYLIHVHVADSNRWAPGMGHLDFPGMVKTLREINYQGVLAVECLPKPEPLIAAKQALSYFRSII